MPHQVFCKSQNLRTLFTLKEEKWPLSQGCQCVPRTAARRQERVDQQDRRRPGTRCGQAARVAPEGRCPWREWSTFQITGTTPANPVGGLKCPEGCPPRRHPTAECESWKGPWAPLARLYGRKWGHSHSHSEAVAAGPEGDRLPPGRGGEGEAHSGGPAGQPDSRLEEMGASGKHHSL